MQNPLPTISEQREFLEDSHEELIRLSDDMGKHIEILRNIVSGAHKYRSYDQNLFDYLHASIDRLNEVIEICRKTANHFEAFHSRLNYYDL